MTLSLKPQAKGYNNTHLLRLTYARKIRYRHYNGTQPNRTVEYNSKEEEEKQQMASTPHSPLPDETY